MGIDFVVLWVDGNDPGMVEKRMHFMEQEGLSSAHTAALPTRFASSDEIRYCVLSIFANTPFVRKVFIVTDGQDPGLDGDLHKFFPERKDSVRIVDHKEIFRGYEEYLPTFNSTSISNMIWRIEGLSETFIYTNDDHFLVRSTRPDYWFREGRPVLRGEWRLPPWKKEISHRFKSFLHQKVLNNKEYQPRLSFYLRQWNGARQAGFRHRYFFHDHIAHPICRSRMENWFRDNEEVMLRNISYRFRSPDQFLISALAYHLEIQDGNTNWAPMDLCYLHPIYSEAKLIRKLNRAREDEGIPNLCVQSLEMMDGQFRDRLYDWLEEILNMNGGNEG